MALADDRMEKSPRPRFSTWDLVVIAGLGSVAGGISMFAATGFIGASLVTALVAGGVAYALTNNIPRNGA
jgi:hypothetical protein